MVAPKGKYNTLEVNMLDYNCRELLRLKTDDSQRLESQIRYYCGFDLLCLDEFPNYDMEDKFLMQEFFNQAKLPDIQ